MVCWEQRGKSVAANIPVTKAVVQNIYERIDKTCTSPAILSPTKINDLHLKPEVLRTE